MKLFTLSLLIGLLSCSPESDRVETILLDCLERSYQEYGVELSRELDALETHLISVGRIESNSGQSYYDFFKCIAENNYIPGELDPNQFEGLLKLTPTEFYSSPCLDGIQKIDSAELKKSGYYKLKVKMREVAADGVVSPGSVADAIISALQPEDFEKPYYRALALVMIVNALSHEPDSGIEPAPLKRMEYADTPTIAIYVAGNGEIRVNDKVVKTESMKTELYAFLKRHQADHLILISADKKTRYDDYMNVSNQISQTYTTLRDEKSKELFDTSFSELSEFEQKKIEAIYPIHMMEKVEKD